MPYAILMSNEGRGSGRQWNPTDIVFDDGGEAGAYVKSENLYAIRYSYDYRYRAIKIGMDNPLMWKQREKQKLEDGTYQLVPWREAYNPTDMYEHIDPNDPTKVRFIANQEDGLQGRYTSMSPGRFIRKYLDNNPYPPDLDKWCASMGLDLTTSPLMVAITAEEIIKVYTEGPHSCMAYSIDEPPFQFVDQHPVSVYGDSDIAVAYIIRRDEITARCIIRPDMGIHGRIYGDSARLLERLKEFDYIEDWDGFVGAKIRRLHTQDDNKHLILPYIDGVLGVVEEGDDWLVLSDKPHIVARSPAGVMSTDCCSKCGAKKVPLKEWRGPDDDYDEPDFICLEGCKR